MNLKLTRFIKYFIGFLIAALFLFFAFKNIDFDLLSATILKLNFIWVIIFFVCINIAHILRAWRWKYLLTPLKEKIKFRNLFAAVNVGFALNNIIPRAGELVRPYSIFKTEGISATSAFSTIVIERMLDSITFYILVLISFIISPNALTILFPFLKNYLTEIIIVLILLTVIFLYLTIKMEKLILILQKISVFLPKKVELKFEELISKLIEGTKVSWQTKTGKKIFILSIAIWAFYIFEMYIVLFAFEDFPKEHLVIQTSTLLLVASSLAYLLPTPSAIGTYHTFIPFVLVSLYDVNPVTALSYAIFTHGIGYISTSIIGGYYFLKDKLHLKEFIN